MSHVQLAEMFLESGLAREEMTDVADLLLLLDDLVADVPTPSAELASLFGSEKAEQPVPLRAARRSAVTGALVLALTGVGATGLSAAANTLPRPIQHKVSQFSQHYLPFDLPEPPPPGPRPRPQSLPALAPLPTEDHGDASVSRSIPTGRPGVATDPAPGLASQAQPAPTAQPSSLPGAPPSYSAQAAAASPAVQPSMTGSPTPTDRPRGGHEGTDPGQDGKDAGHGSSPGPDKGGSQGTDPGTDPGTGPGTDSGKDPGQGHDKGGKHGQPGKPDPGGQKPVPAPSAPLPTVPQPQPDPDPPTPTLPLPDPLPDLGRILATGPAGDGLLGLG